MFHGTAAWVYPHAQIFWSRQTPAATCRIRQMHSYKYRWIQVCQIGNSNPIKCFICGKAPNKTRYRHTSFYYVSLYCASNTWHYLHAESKTLHQQKYYDSPIAVVWNHTRNISAVCLHYLPSMYMIRALLDNSEQIKAVQWVFVFTCKWN